jgi:hypothetical protein
MGLLITHHPREVRMHPTILHPPNKFFMGASNSAIDDIN